MLDPLSSISLAGTIVQFLDFGSRLVSKASLDQTNSGPTLADREQLNFAIARLADLRAPLQGIPENHGSGYGEELTSLAKECQEAADNLFGALERIRERGTSKSRRWNSSRQVIQSVWKKNELEAFQNELSRLRTSVDTVILYKLRADAARLNIQQSERFQQLEQSTQTIIQALTSDRTAVGVSEPSQLQQFEDQTVAIALLDRDENDYTVHSTKQGSQRSLDTRLKAQIELLKLLSFPVMADRYESIEQAHSKTFDWIFDKSSSSFPDWLCQGSGIYWISGKTASGKSTMMKHIFQSPVTQELLTPWAKPQIFTSAAFFFWNSGSPLERSQNGLLRSLLYTVLKQQPSLLAVVLPHQWALLYSKLATPTFSSEYPEIEPWSQEELKLAFKKLIIQDLVPLKLFLLVDGLDEYAGNPDDIVNLFKEISSSPNVKAVVSSRQLVAIEHSFQNCPGLILQHLNYGDIHLFVADKLEKTVAFQVLSTSKPGLANQVIDEIMQRANGVFLWAKLVVDLTLRGLDAGDSLETINAKIQSVPYELADLEVDAQPLSRTSEAVEFDDLYNRLWAEIPAAYHSGASQILQIIQAMRRVRERSVNDGEDAEPLTLIDLALADGDPEETINAAVRPWGQFEIRRRCNIMERRLRLELPGFVEIQTSNDQNAASINPGSRIQYSHRATREYVDAISGNKLIEYTANSTFNPYVSLIKSCVQHLKILNPQRSRQRELLLWFFVTTSLLCAHYFEAEAPLSKAYTALLMALDRTMEEHHLKSLKDEQGSWLERTFVLETKVKSDNGWGARKDAKLHWSNFYPLHAQPREWKNSFLSLVVQFGLSKFISQRLRSDDKALKCKKGRPLLDYGLSPLPSLEHDLITLEVIKALLDHGASPNEKFGTNTCWQNALLWQYEHFVTLVKSRNSTTMSKAKHLAETRLKIFELLIEHKADADAWIKTDRTKVSVETILSQCFKLCAPERLEELKKVVAVRRAKSSIFSFRTLAF